VSAVGEQEQEGWLGPLNKAIYPANGRFRNARPAEAAPRFGTTTVLNRPWECPPDDDPSVMPGLHIPRAGTHPVVWWCPQALRLGVEPDFGLRQEDLLSEGPSAAEAVESHERWLADRARLIERGQVPSVEQFTAWDAAAAPENAREVHKAATPRAGKGPGGKRYGTLVHAVLRDLPLDSPASVIQGAVEIRGRALGCSKREMEAATAAVAAAWSHALLESARKARTCYREYPVSVKLEDGRLLDAVIDLAFSDGRGWTIVDFKTDTQARYEHQLQWYALALERATGQPVQTWLLAV
jgi:hypothetical protein